MNDVVSKSLIRVVESQKNFVRFLDGMDPIQMLPYLKRIISEHDEQLVQRCVTNAGRSDREANQKLWSALKRLPCWWEPFMAALKACGYTQLSDILRNELNRMKLDREED
ncbi:uncharacterized protein LOC121384302 [Gigantopelta aegis]|uniref:uncharacterized protein LOC121384302 n=1 Tax=Gigantopelta aegis TaxID=1735272 RepID=UPI001B88C170|nr:uncharacterized protein LOC121384302 [Gigantopelta aegis]